MKGPTYEHLWPVVLLALAVPLDLSDIPVFVSGMWTALLLSWRFGWRKQ